MKTLITTLFILLLAAGHASAQQRDTIRLVEPPRDTLQFNRYLRLDTKDKIVSPYGNPGEKSYALASDRKAFKWNKIQEMPLFNASYSRFIIPTAFVSYGVLARKYAWMQELDHSTSYEIGEHFTKSIWIDDYLQYAPAVAVLALDFMGIKAKHNCGDRVFVLATANLLTFASVQTLKRTTRIERPDGSNLHSFPSGHTASAFAGAHILFKEYNGASPWISLAGYAAAGATGVMRVYNRRHWVSDVVTGAGVGILSVEASYFLLPVFQSVFNTKSSKKKFAVAPVFGDNNNGVAFACSF